ncbi:copper amine oxidase N-terminal domain-containing protein [Brevibacillus sp. H7]|jgi:hypothetical protein|uniref:copper amine oxidase N-terminal domain-containing protein n=1 Tax=Brevibacillus sp. H7 TaxID=3349138 RepID=UPI0037F4984F
MFKKWAALVLAIALVPSAATAAPAATVQANIKVVYHQKAIAFPDQKPVIRDQRTLVPIRPIAEGLGFDVDWNTQTRTVTIVKGANSVKLVVSQKIAKRNGETITLDVPAQIINQRTMVPVRFIAEALNYDVNWEAATQTVLITDKAAATNPGTEQSSEQKPSDKPAVAHLIDKESVSAKAASFAGIGFMVISGKVDAGSSLVVEIDDKNYEANVKSDGSFAFELVEKTSAETFTLKATKGNETDVFEGTFTFKN